MCRSNNTCIDCEVRDPRLGDFHKKAKRAWRMYYRESMGESPDEKIEYPLFCYALLRRRPPPPLV